MIRLFRSQYLFQYILLLVLTVILWGDALLFPEKLFTGGGFENFPTIAAFIHAYPLLCTIASILLLYFQALLLNDLVGRHRLLERNQLITAAIYILMMSSLPEMVQPNIILVVNLGLILLLFSLLKLYGKGEAYSNIFDTGFLIGIVSLLFFPSIYYLFFVLIALIIFQFFRWREWLIPIIGLMLPYIFLASYFFWCDELGEQVQVFVSEFTFRIPEFEGFPIFEMGIFSLFLILFLPGLVRMYKSSTEGTVDVRKKSSLILIMLLFSLALVFFSREAFIWHLLIVFIPAGIILGAWVSKLKKLFFPELIMWLIFIGILFTKVLNFS